MPKSELPTLANLKEGDVSDEWKDYFAQVARTEPFNKLNKIVANHKTWQAEAESLFQALEGADFDQWEQYIENNPPSSGAIVFLVLVAQDKFKTEMARKAAQSPRPKKKPTHRSVAIAAMKSWRKSTRTAFLDAGTFSDFLDGASEGSVEGLKIELKQLRGVVKYSVDGDDLLVAKPFSRRTLEDWWTDAGK